MAELKMMDVRPVDLVSQIKDEIDRVDRRIDDVDTQINTYHKLEDKLRRRYAWKHPRRRR